MSYEQDPSDNTPVPIEALHSAIKTAMRSFWTTQQVPTVGFYTRQTTKIIAPAVFFELASIAGEAETQTEQFAGTFRFSAYCIVPYAATNAILAAKVLAAELVAFVQGNRWSQPIGRARVTLVETELMEGEAPSYETVRVDWEQDGLLGASVFNDDGCVTPTEVWLGFEPNVGPEHVGDYLQVFPDPDAEEAP